MSINTTAYANNYAINNVNKVKIGSFANKRNCIYYSKMELSTLVCLLRSIKRIAVTIVETEDYIISYFLTFHKIKLININQLECWLLASILNLVYCFKVRLVANH